MEGYSVKEAMDLLDVSRDTIYRWMNSGELDFVVVGSRRRIPQRAIDEFIAARTRAEKQRIAEKNEAPGRFAVVPA